MTTLLISNKLYLKRLPRDVAARIKERLTLKNPVHETLKRMGNTKALYACPKDFKYYEDDVKTDTLVVPRGCQPWVEALLKDNHVPYEKADETIAPEAHFAFNITLRDYQKGLVELSDRHRSGVFHLSVGFGKSLIALKLIERLKTRSLIIVPRIDLLNQFLLELKKALPEDAFKRQVGVISGKKTQIKDITIGTVQSVVRRIEEGVLPKDSFGCVIVDEAHAFTTAKWRKCLTHFTARSIYGLTGTADRNDGQKEAIFFLCGDVIAERTLPRETPTVRIVNYAKKIFEWEYPEVIKSQIEDDERNSLLIHLILQEIRQGRQVLVLTKRISHWQALQEKLGLIHGMNKDMIYGISAKRTKERTLLMEELRSGKRPFHCLFSTFSLLATGVDVPSLSCLVIASDLKSRILSQQAAGRILRILEGKKDPVVIDINDTGNPILNRQGKGRKKMYEDLKWKVDVV